MFLSIFSFFIFVSIATSVKIVPGTIQVRVLPDNQVANNTYKPSATVRYVVEFDGVPMDDNVLIGVEIRGTNPAGGPRGYIAMARSPTTIKEFVKQAKNGAEFTLTPKEVYAGYYWFIRPHLFYADDNLVSTNMMNAAGSEMFSVLKQ